MLGAIKVTKEACFKMPIFHILEKSPEVSQLMNR